MDFRLPAAQEAERGELSGAELAPALPRRSPVVEFLAHYKKEKKKSFNIKRPAQQLDERAPGGHAGHTGLLRLRVCGLV